MVLDGWRPPQPMLGVLLMKTLYVVIFKRGGLAGPFCDLEVARDWYKRVKTTEGEADIRELVPPALFVSNRIP